MRFKAMLFLLETDVASDATLLRSCFFWFVSRVTFGAYAEFEEYPRQSFISHEGE